MEERVAQALEERYLGKKVRDDCTDWWSLEDDCILSADATIEEDEEDEEAGTEITENMGIQIELDEDNRISGISISFHTSSWGDSGLGEEDPEDYWNDEECIDAGAEFIENILEAGQV